MCLIYIIYNMSIIYIYETHIIFFTTGLGNSPYLPQSQAIGAMTSMRCQGDAEHRGIASNFVNTLMDIEWKILGSL